MIMAAYKSKRFLFKKKLRGVEDMRVIYRKTLERLAQINETVDTNFRTFHQVVSEKLNNLTHVVETGLANLNATFQTYLQRPSLFELITFLILFLFSLCSF